MNIASPGEQGFFDVQLLIALVVINTASCAPSSSSRNLGRYATDPLEKWLQAAARSQAAGLT